MEQRFLWLVLALMMAQGSARAEPTQIVKVQGRSVFEGDPKTASVDARGHISMGPQVFKIARVSDHPIVSMLAVGKHIFVGTAGDGLFRVDQSGKTKSMLAGEKLVISALAVHKGKIYAALNPGGLIKVLDPAGANSKAAKAAKTFVDLDAKYIWSMWSQGNDLLVATGAPGQVLRISPNKKTTVRLKTSETHVRALHLQPKGFIAGGGDKGIIYRTEKNGVRALYDSELQEVTALAMNAKTGALYAALVSAEESGTLLANKWIGPLAGEAKDAESPLKSSEVVRVLPDGEAEVIWKSSNEGALTLHHDGARLLIGTGTGKKGRGRIYAIDEADRDRVHLIARTEPTMVTQLAPGPVKGSLLIATAPIGELHRLAPGTRAKAVYFSAAKDLGRISRVGRVWFDAKIPKSAKVQLSIRTGHTKKPDDTWSEFSKATPLPSGAGVVVPRGRYAQFKLELFRAKRGAAPRVKGLFASVVRMNVPPSVGEVFLFDRGVYMAPIPKEQELEKSISLSESTIKELRGLEPPEEESQRVRQGWKKGMMTVAWTATDPNKDKLLYRVELQRLDPEGDFQTIADDRALPFLTFDSRAHPDGRYNVRVTATDRPTNPPTDALTDRLISEPFSIDNTPPKLSALNATSKGQRMIVGAKAQDLASRISRAEVSIGGGPWLMLPAKDGLLDAQLEELRLEVLLDGGLGAPKIKKGRVSVLVRVMDEAGNETSASTQVAF